MKSEETIYIRFQFHESQQNKHLNLYQYIKEFEQKFYTTVLKLLFKSFYKIVNNKEFSENY